MDYNLAANQRVTKTSKIPGILDMNTQSLFEKLSNSPSKKINYRQIFLITQESSQRGRQIQKVIGNLHIFSGISGEEIEQFRIFLEFENQSIQMFARYNNGVRDDISKPSYTGLLALTGENNGFSFYICGFSLHIRNMETKETRIINLIHNLSQNRNETPYTILDTVYPSLFFKKSKIKDPLKGRKWTSNLWSGYKSDFEFTIEVEDLGELGSYSFNTNDKPDFRRFLAVIYVHNFDKDTKKKVKSKVIHKYITSETFTTVEDLIAETLEEFANMVMGMETSFIATNNFGETYVCPSFSREETTEE